jgi:hypothetical protein
MARGVVGAGAGQPALGVTSGPGHGWPLVHGVAG